MKVGDTVQLWSEGAWRKNMVGQVIGLCEGVAGLLMSNGIYMDVPVQYLRVLKKQKGRKMKLC